HDRSPDLTRTGHPACRATRENSQTFADRGGTTSIMPVTNAIEALNAKLRRAVRTRGHFPSAEAAMKLLFLVLHLTERDWKMPPKEWGMARAQFAILFEDRFPIA
ncbi:MAG: transposase, partial [Alphaproteobacteria bacterium]